MDTITLRHQIVVFGSYDEITPSMETIKYFIDVFSDKNLIPSQFKEINVNLTGTTLRNTNSTRLSLTSTNSMWNVKFNVDRIDVLLTNSNIGKIDMPETDSFISEVEDIMTKVHKKFPKTHKRVALVSQYIFKDIDIKKSFENGNKSVAFFEEKPIIEWSNRAACRMPIHIPEQEVLNISSELRWIKTNLKIKDKIEVFDGLILNVDINTINENQNYRFNNANIKTLLKEMANIADEIKNQNIEILSK